MAMVMLHTMKLRSRPCGTRPLINLTPDWSSWQGCSRSETMVRRLSQHRQISTHVDVKRVRLVARGAHSVVDAILEQHSFAGRCFERLTIRGKDGIRGPTRIGRV